MGFLRSLRWPTLRNRSTSWGIDLGDGRQLPAEDVLEGHFRRLTESTSRSEELRVQVTPTLSAAIRVMAPQLAPLTAIAEELASTFPTVHPAPDFRRDLHSALEMAHRQHVAQRALFSSQQRENPRANWPWIALGGGVLAIALIAALWGIFVLRRGRHPDLSS